MIKLFKLFLDKIIIRIQKLLSPRIIKVSTNVQKEFILYNPPFNLETRIYWQGFEKVNWELKTREIWSSLCSKSNTIFDIGANTGIFSVLAKVYNPDSLVYAFEPQPNIYKVLDKNNNLNKFDICCEDKALSSSKGIFPFYNYGWDPFGSGNTTAGSLNQKWRPKNQQTIEVEVITLDDYIDFKKIKKIDLMKIDVETFEAEVIEGYKDNLHMHKPIIILEVQNHNIGNKINNYFIQNNYSYFNIDEDLGLIPINELGNDFHRNYLICPNEELESINSFIKKL